MLFNFISCQIFRHLLRNKWLLIILLLVSSNAFACIWQSEHRDHQNPFWESSAIEVCFVPPNPPQQAPGPNPLDQEYQNIYIRNMQIAQHTLIEQINNRGGFQLFGFNICPQHESGRQRLNPKIRINLNGHQGHGARAMSIGPASSHLWQNIFINSHNFEWPGNIKPDAEARQNTQMQRVFNNAEHMSWVSLHETMHILGFHHSEYWNLSFNTIEPVSRLIQIGDQMDQRSIMFRSFRNYNDEGIAQLSETDVLCLQKVVDQTILLEPSRPAQLSH